MENFISSKTYPNRISPSEIPRKIIKTWKQFLYSLVQFLFFSQSSGKLINCLELATRQRLVVVGLLFYSNFKLRELRLHLYSKCHMYRFDYHSKFKKNDMFHLL